jgi:CRISPR-associated protein Csd1
VILQALYKLAYGEKLMEDPDFEWKPIAWLITVGDAGELLGIHGTHTVPQAEEGKKKPKPRPKSFAVPREPGRTSGDRAFFLYDKSEYALGLDPETDPAKRRPADKLASRLALFHERAEECLAATGDEGVRAVCAFLDRLRRGTLSIDLPEGCASNDLFAFIYAKDADRLVTFRPRVEAYWRSLRAQPQEAEADRQLCLVSGELTVPVKKLDGIKNVPGGGTSGIALVSFNSNAFESYGWSGNENAPISRKAAEACTTALNRLLHPAFPNPDPEHPGETLPPRSLRLSADTAVAFWSSRTGASAEDDLTAQIIALLEGDPASVGELYRSLWRGEIAAIDDPASFYALTLTGTQGRAVLRDWFESTVRQVAANLARHFADLAIVRNTPPPKGREHPPALPMRLLVRSLAPFGDEKRVPAALASQLVRSGLEGFPYPLAILQRALERTRAEIGRDDWSDLERRDLRAALIKAVLVRRRRFHLATTSYPEITESMDPTNTNPGYLLGRLLAILERMQTAALGDVNASVVDRFFGSASATPKAVFPRLLKNFHHHARKAMDGKSAGWAVLLRTAADEIISEIKDFPLYLSLEEQGLFVLGYHHQRHELSLSKEERARRREQESAATETQGETVR